MPHEARQLRPGHFVLGHRCTASVAGTCKHPSWLGTHERATASPGNRLRLQYPNAVFPSEARPQGDGPCIASAVNAVPNASGGMGLGLARATGSMRQGWLKDARKHGPVPQPAPNHNV